ncbi:Flagellum-specific peptidoglycan hydrolase FlgJ [Tepidimicrobium xylanilyticum]|uniref:Flagellum-specific peptidoglycan hydrolase FlgJ n=2 Tax=Tepidimicrobium xylanilyticum TaxID=1123352 RepID=A0A1H2ZEY4_9FIRM|nr:Flagellum-specific peptidoglycan hydrolase FlgJ [Tepidimicrobium xylanilyticum]
MNMKGIKKLIFLILIIAIILPLGFSLYPLAAKPIRLLVDGKDITSKASPIIEKGRTLVPIRFVAEELGAKVSWIHEDRKVIIQKGQQVVDLKIDSYLVMSKDEKKNYILSDTTPKIIDDRTYVPLRLISNALGVGIEWDEENRIVRIDSNKVSEIESFFPIKISSLESGQTIKGKTELGVEFLGEDSIDGKEIKYLLLNPETRKGYVVARGKDLKGNYSWIPNLKDKGERVLVAAIYDEEEQFIAGDAVQVYLEVTPKVSLMGVKEGEVLNDVVNLMVDTSFVASRVKYQITNLDKGETKIFGEDTPIDPYGEYRWIPNLKDNGNYSFKAIVYDMENNSYESNEIIAKIEVMPKLSLSGVAQGQTIDKPVNLLASRNFDASETQYILRDPISKAEEVLAVIPYGSYRWFPGPEISGENELLVRVKDTRGQVHESEPIRIKTTGKPIILLDGIGPNQVIRDTVKLRVRSNVDLESVSYVLINKNTNKQKVIANDVDAQSEQSYTPKKEDTGYWKLVAIGKLKGKEIISDEIPFRVYLGEIHKSVPIIEKEKFLSLASGLAKKSWEKTGMSAALQTAQSILETGWGQSVPVDKYSGKVSYNLFGIKGKGPAGSVIYNTWEVYNGQTYYVDAEFRAYNSVEESWNDHKSLLLNSDRYEPFRQVMHNSYQGAWALKRAGYATDPEYALKLIRIIKQYELEKLDIIDI